jgi:hypothetical protein
MRELEPAERVGVEQALVAMETRDCSAEFKEIQWHIGKLLSHWDSNQAALVKTEIMADWGHDISKAGYSVHVIADACEKWRTTQKFRPHVSEFLEICRGLQARDEEAIRRARVLLGLEAPRAMDRAALPKPAPEEAAVTHGLLAALPPKPRSLAAPAPRLVPQDPPRRSIAEVRAQLAREIDPVAAAKLASIRKSQES